MGGARPYFFAQDFSKSLMLPLEKGSFLRNLKLGSQLKIRMLCMTGIQRVHDSNSHCENLLFGDYRIHAHVHKPFDIANLQPFSVLLSIRIYLSEKAQGGWGDFRGYKIYHTQKCYLNCEPCRITCAYLITPNPPFLKTQLICRLNH